MNTRGEPRVGAQPTHIAGVGISSSVVTFTVAFLHVLIESFRGCSSRVYCHQSRWIFDPDDAVTVTYMWKFI